MKLKEIQKDLTNYEGDIEFLQINDIDESIQTITIRESLFRNEKYLTDIDRERLYKDDLLIRDKILKLEPEVKGVLKKVYSDLLNLANKNISEYEIKKLV